MLQLTLVPIDLWVIKNRAESNSFIITSSSITIYKRKGNTCWISFSFDWELLEQWLCSYSCWWFFPIRYSLVDSWFFKERIYRKCMIWWMWWLSRICYVRVISDYYHVRYYHYCKLSDCEYDCLFLIIVL